MSDTPKFEVIDRRKIKAEEEQENSQHQTPAEPEKPSAGPQLVVNEPRSEAAEPDQPDQPELPPGVGAQPPLGFEQLVQQFYVSAMIQMGAGAQDGQRPRVDILGARATIDLLGVLAEKTKGNLTEAEDRTLQTVLFEARMAFLELTSMISLQAMQPPTPPPPGKK